MSLPKTNPWWWNAVVFGVFLISVYLGALYFNASIAFRFSATLSILVLFSITPFWGHKNWISRFEKLVRGKASWRKLVLNGLLVGLGLTVLRILANSIFGHVSVLRKEFEMSAVLWLGILLLSGIAEELYFRGHLMKNVSSRETALYPLVVQGGWFTLYHVAGSPYLRVLDFPYYFAMGLVFGWLATRDKCLLSAIVAHLVFNFAQFFIA